MSEAVNDARAQVQPSGQTDRQAEQARVGLVGDFLGAFENTYKSQANGTIQLANRFGADIDEHKLAPVDKADFGTMEWGAQLAGQASALALEFFAARKLGAVVEALGGKQSLGTTFGTLEPAGTRMRTSLNFGAFMGGVLTPTDNPDTFWSDRLKNMFSSTVTMGTMTGASLAMEARAAGLSGGAWQTILRNGYFNNAVGGVLGGGVGDMTASALNGNLPSLDANYWQQVGRSATEFGLVGGGTHSLNLGAGKIHQFASDHAGAIADHLQNLADRTAMTLGLTPLLQPECALAGGGKYFNTAADKSTPSKVEWPQKPAEQTTVLMKAKGNGGSEVPVARASETAVTKETETAVARETGPAISDRAREVLDNPRLKPFLDKIDSKFNRPLITEQQLLDIVEQLPAKDRPLAAKLLEASMPNSSPTIFAQRMKAMNTELSNALGEDNGRFIAKGDAGFGKAFGYLFRKLSNRSGRIYAGEATSAEGKTSILLDDVNTTSYTAEDLQGFQKATKLYVLDHGGFEKGVNFLDYAKGPEAVAAKLKGLIDESKQLRRSEPSLQDDDLVRRVINGKISDTQSLNANVQIIDAPYTPADPAPATDVASTLQRVYSGITQPWAPREKVADFIGSFVPRNREPVAYMLGEGTHPVSYQDMVNLSRDVHRDITEHARSLGIPEKNLLYHETDGDSVNLINYLHRVTNGIPADQFASGGPIADLAKEGKLADKAVVMMDDANYTHSKLDFRIQFTKGLENAKALLSGSLLSYSNYYFERGQQLGLKQFSGKRLNKRIVLSGTFVANINDACIEVCGPNQSLPGSLFMPTVQPES